jgi:formate dehydrogenase subunit gamma
MTSRGWSGWRAAAMGLVVAFAALAPAADAVAQSTSVNPTAKSVKEQQLLEALKPSERVSGRISIPDRNASNLIQPEGRNFRAERDESARYGGYAILGMLGVLVLFYLIRGRIRISSGPAGTTITRFGFVDRFAHWLTATSFLLLALTGLNITFGRSLLLPLVGPETFTTLSQTGKFVHNYVSFAFVFGIVLMFLLWVKDNLPSGRDFTWLAQGGGIIGSAHPPADRFNGGQKLIFWAVVGIGAAIAYTGFLMMFPFAFADIAGMQWANVWHSFLGLVLFAIIIAHIYIGSIGMEGAFDAMGSGEVDVNWAREHHSIWTDKVLSKSGRNAAPAE